MIWLLWWTVQPVRADIPPPGSHLPKRGERTEDLPPPDLPPYAHEWSTAELSLLLVAVLVVIVGVGWLLRRRFAPTD